MLLKCLKICHQNSWGVTVSNFKALLPFPIFHKFLFYVAIHTFFINNQFVSNQFSQDKFPRNFQARKYIEFSIM